METTITDSQKMQTILDEIGISSYRLTKELNMSSGAVYHILSGKNNLSKNIIDKICTLYPEVNKKYLIKGIGDPITESKPNMSDEYILVKKQDLDQLKQDIQNIYELINKKTTKK